MFGGRFEDQLLADARRHLAKVSPDAARKSCANVWAYGMRVAENPSEHLEDDLGDLDMNLATLQAVGQRLVGA